MYADYIRITVFRTLMCDRLKSYYIRGNSNGYKVFVNVLHLQYGHASLLNAFDINTYKFTS